MGLSTTVVHGAGASQGADALVVAFKSGFVQVYDLSPLATLHGGEVAFGALRKDSAVAGAEGAAAATCMATQRNATDQSTVVYLGHADGTISISCLFSFPTVRIEKVSRLGVDSSCHRGAIAVRQRPAARARARPAARSPTSPLSTPFPPSPLQSITVIGFWIVTTDIKGATNAWTMG